MEIATTNEQKEIIRFLKNLRETIIASFTDLDDKNFQRTPWNYERGRGGGEMAVLRGSVFEKAAVNWSGIEGDEFPMDDGKGSFFATGISLITHMTNPHAPTVHCNLRYLQTKNQWWFGGGFDLTPMGMVYEEDKEHFHDVAQKILDPFSLSLYPKFSQAAKEYFYIPHRKKERGVGGIFFDHFNTGDFSKDFQLWRAIGDGFLETIMPIYRRRIDQPYTTEDRQKQLIFRAHYVEFNLLYDRGTKFGFVSGGNPDAILCSMPPLVSW